MSMTWLGYIRNDWLVVWLFGWLFGWLIDWLISWLVVWLVGWLDGWLFGWLFGWLDVGRSIVGTNVHDVGYIPNYLQCSFGTLKWIGGTSCHTFEDEEGPVCLIVKVLWPLLIAFGEEFTEPCCLLYPIPTQLRVNKDRLRGRDRVKSNQIKSGNEWAPSITSHGLIQTQTD